MAFLVISFRPTRAEFLRDREDALIVASQLATGPDASHMEVMSPISKPASEAGGMSDEGKKTNSMHISLFCFHLRDILSLILALRRTLSFPYQWAVSIFAFIYCGRSLFLSPAP